MISDSDKIISLRSPFKLIHFHMVIISGLRGLSCISQWRVDGLKIAVIGAGAMGGLIGGLLRLSGLDVTLVEKNQDIVDAISKKGLVIVDGESTINVSDIKIVDEGRLAYPADYALVLVKSYHTRSAGIEAEKALSGDGIAVTLQNGLGNIETLASILGWHRVLAGVTTWGATLVEPGVVRIGGKGYIKLGAPKGGHGESLHRLVEAFNRAMLNASISDDILRDIWIKVAVNAAINPVTALTRARNGEVLEDRNLLNIALEAACEAVEVAKAEGVSVPDCSEVREAVINVMKTTSSNVSSMLQDIVRCRPTEIDAISGEVYRRGLKYGVNAGVNRILYSLVKNLESRACRKL